MPELSIITVCLNNKTGLNKTFKSVFTQIFTNYEFIIIDGGSTDGSKELIREFNEKISFWVSEKDTGIYNAMNKGIKHAKGEYCLFLNSGDTLASKDVLHKVFAENYETDIIYGNLVIQKGKRNFRIKKYPDELAPHHFYPNVLSLHHQASFIKRKLFDKYGLYREDLKIIADWEFFLRAIILNKCSTRHIGLNVTIFDSFGISSNNNITEYNLKVKILKENFSENQLQDIKELSLLKANFKTKIKSNFEKNSPVYSILRILYLSFVKLIEKINYAIINKSH